MVKHSCLNHKKNPVGEPGNTHKNVASVMSSAPNLQAIGKRWVNAGIRTENSIHPWHKI